MRYIIFPNKFGSGGAKELARSINGKRIRDIGRYRPLHGDFIVNWGNTKSPSWNRIDVNKPDAVACSVDKVRALEKMTADGVATVVHTTDKAVAKGWVDAGETVYARTLTRASQGRGIVIVEPHSTVLPFAKLYTIGIESPIEYRVHVANGKVIDYAKKIPLRQDATIKIKSHTNGWTFARNVERGESIQKLAVDAVKSLGLDFGAVDVIVDPKNKNRPKILEVNSAPGLVGRTIGMYANAVKELYTSINTKQNA